MARRFHYGPLLAVLALAGIGAAMWHYRPWERTPVPPPADPAPARSAESAAAADPPPPAQERFPIEQVAVPVETEAGPLPDPDASDGPFLDALSAALGHPAGDWLVSQYVIPKLVATIDNLPNRRVTRQIYAAHPLPGTLAVAEADARLWLDDANAARYDAAVRAFEKADLRAVVAVYVRFYPLFQRAYRDLGGPGVSFNDRLVEVIDHLLAAPDAAGPIELRRAANGAPRLEFADPQREAASVGHKAMWRIGPSHAARVKAQLRELRALLAGQRPQA